MSKTGLVCDRQDPGDQGRQEEVRSQSGEPRGRISVVVVVVVLVAWKGRWSECGLLSQRKAEERKPENNSKRI